MGGGFLCAQSYSSLLGSALAHCVTHSRQRGARPTSRRLVMRHEAGVSATVIIFGEYTRDRSIV